MYKIILELCSACGICFNNCINGAIDTSSGIIKIDQSWCNQCGSCMEFCPDQAIDLFLENDEDGEDADSYSALPEYDMVLY